MPKKKRVKYEKRIVCFLDILGFKTKINETTGKSYTRQNRVQKIHDVLSVINERYVSNVNIGEYNRIQKRNFTQFSDSLVISFDFESDGEILNTLIDLLHISFTLAWLGFLVRGSVCVGKIFHSKEMVFGPGLVDAYETESKKAIYPRILISKEIVEQVQRINPNDYFEPENANYFSDLVKKDLDGVYYIDYIGRPAELEMDDSFEYIKYLEKIKILAGNNMKTTTPEVSLKYQWLARKYNLRVKELFYFRDTVASKLDERLISEINSLELLICD